MSKWMSRPDVLVRPLAVARPQLRVDLDRVLFAAEQTVAQVRRARPYDWARDCPELGDDWCEPTGPPRPVAS